MDVGDLRVSIFVRRLRQEDLTGHDRTHLKHLIRGNVAKLKVLRLICEEARQRYLLVLYQWRRAVNTGTPSTTYALRFQLSALETALHLLKRYHLVLSQQGLCLQASYRMAANSTQMSQALRDAGRRVLQRPPSVHDHFLLQEVARRRD